MSRNQGEDGAADPAKVHGADVVISVARSGGITGVPRTWMVVPPPDEEAHWAVLIDRCPWGDDSGRQSGADRFTWHIHVQLHDDQHEQVVADAHLSGPWRELVEAVRAADTPLRPSS